MKIQYKYLLLIAWMVVIFLLSNEVAGTSHARSAAIVGVLVNSLHVSLPENVLMFLTRKAAHIVAYFVLGMLMYNVVKEYKYSIKCTILLSILFALGYAAFDEIHQLFVSGRSGQVTDVLIDTTASSVGVSVYYFVYKIQSSRINSKDTL